ncbi:MAG: hypothetical protein KGI84_02875, partial [Elusimicrobia bacterium]|nr:hypothetical protein [Elusimicrobiota bacterium]
MERRDKARRVSALKRSWCLALCFALLNAGGLPAVFSPAAERPLTVRSIESLFLRGPFAGTAALLGALLNPPDASAQTFEIMNKLLVDGSSTFKGAALFVATTAPTAQAGAGSLYYDSAKNQLLVDYNNTGGWVPLATGTISASALSGTGSSNYDEIWTGANTLGAGLLYESGGNVGIGTASPKYMLNVSGTVGIGVASTPNNNSSLQIGLYGVTLFTNPGNYNAIDNEPFIVYNSAPTSGMAAFDTDIGAGGSATIPSVIGYGAYPYYNGTGTVTTLTAFDAGPSITAGTVTTMKGVNVGNISGATNNYDIYTNESAGANNFALYNAGAGKSYFAGNVGIGSTSPGYKLDVQGGQINASGGLCINGTCQTSWTSGG